MNNPTQAIPYSEYELPIFVFAHSFLSLESVLPSAGLPRRSFEPQPLVDTEQNAHIRLILRGVVFGI